jgi:hypothetical protein
MTLDDKSSPDRPAIGGRSLPDRTPIAGPSPANRSAATNRPASRWNLRTTNGRRCRDLYRGYLIQLGNPIDAPTVALVVAAAEAIVLAEVARQECLAGMNGLNAELMIRCENSAARALRRLGLNQAAPPSPQKSFSEKMAELEAAKAPKGPAS